MDILITVATKVGEYAVAPIGHQLGYLFFYNRNIKDLEEKLKNLETTRSRVQILVNESRGNADEIYDDVSTWLVEVDAELPSMPQKNDGRSYRNTSNPSCFNLIQRHQLSRKTTKRVKDILELIEKGNKFDKVGHPAPLPYTSRSTLPADYQILKSRTLKAKQIMDALVDPNVNKVGVYGMGGVGKTMLLDEVKKLVLEDKLFDRVIDVIVGQSNGVAEIQDQIGGKLNMGLNKKAESKEGRAPILQNKLVEMKNNILIILDDLWKEYDLEKEVGIPCRSKLSQKGCKILMTSRFQDILTNNMNTEKCFQVNPLDEEESWKFFMKIIGDKFDKVGTKHIAKDVAKKCGGLPLLLRTIAKTLKGKDLRIWKDALKRLKNSTIVEIEGMDEKVYPILRLSYDYLKGEAQSLFLLCSVFSDDYKISVKTLQMYAMGMRLLDKVNTWDEARNRVIKLVDNLKSSCLLLQVDSSGEYVQIHDVIRDVAKYISSKEANMSTLNYGYKLSEWRDEDRCGSYRAIFVDCKYFRNLPPDLKFPKLELLIIRFNIFHGSDLQILDAFFEGMDKLKVLEMRNMYFQPLWRSLTHSLKSLRTLCMSVCKFNDIDAIGQLKKLEILRINECMIQELPVSMSQLTRLKVLEVSYCSSLRVIPANIISSMRELEELNLWSSFNRWGEELWHKNEWIMNAKLSELNCLPGLSNLRLEILNVNLVLDDLSSQTWKLEEFCICVGDSHWRFHMSDKCAKALMLNIKSENNVSIDGVLEMLMQECEELQVRDSMGFTKDLFQPNGNYGYPSLKHLDIFGNSDMPHLMGNMSFSYFTSLESLTLTEMKRMENIVSRSALTNPFEKLKTIKVKRCVQLRSLFSFSIFKVLSDLREIEVDTCRMMNGIVSEETEQPTIRMECSTRLSSLQLMKVNKLASFCTKQLIQENSQTIIPFFDDQVSFPELENLTMEGANNLEMLWHDNGPTPNSFCKLQNLSITFCNKLRYMFPSNMVKSLIFLNTLQIRGCELLERIFTIEEPTFNDAKIVPLRKLSLMGLPNLKYVWSKDPGEFVAFPNLKEVDVSRCPKVKSLFPASFVKHLQHIRSLQAHELDEMFTEDTSSKLGFPEIVLFPRLRHLEMASMIVKRSFWFRSESFPKLLSLTIIGSEGDDMKTLPLEMNQALYSIEELKMENVDELVQVFGNDEENNHNHNQSRANLKRLDLNNLPNLMDVWKDSSKMNPRFDSLEHVDVRKCENLKNLLPSSITFFNLSVVYVRNCNGMMNLFSSSMAKSLVNLRHIEISGCGGMSSIVAGDQEENGEIVFKKLTDLVLKDLPRLVSFHSGKCTFKFPCLYWLNIERCPEMETFSHGNISMPMLEYMMITEGPVSVSPVGINVVIQNFWKDEIMSSIKILFTQEGEEDSTED